MMNDGTYSTIYDLLFSITKVQSKQLADYLLEQLSSCKYLDNDEKTSLEEFKSLVEVTKGIPSSETLVSKNIIYSTANTIQENSLENFVNIFIYNKEGAYKASQVTNLMMEYNKSGANRDEISEKVNDILADGVETKNDIIEAYDIENKLKEILEIPEVKGIPYGIPCIDEIYPGTTPGSFSVLAGYTGSMKTTLAANHCFIHMLLGKNVLYFTLEVSETDLIMSLMSLYTISCTNEPIKRDDIRKLRTQNKEKFSKIYNDLMSLPGKIVFRDEKTIGETSTSNYRKIIKDVNKELKEKYSQGLDLIVLDHAQLLKYNSDNKNRDPYQVLNQWTDFFRKFASRDGYAVMLVSQTSRGGYEYATRHGGQYLLTGLAEGNELERGATCVISLYSNEESKASGEVSVQVLKNRYGPVMLEPQTTTVKPEYYLVGNGYNTNAQQVDAIFEDGEMPSNPFENQDVENLDNLLGGM